MAVSVAVLDGPCVRAVLTVIVAVPEPLAGGENSISRSRRSRPEGGLWVSCPAGKPTIDTGVSSQLFIAAPAARAVQSASNAARPLSLGAGLMNDPVGPVTVIVA